jgi:hypothetical protein
MSATVASKRWAWRVMRERRGRDGMEIFRARPVSRALVPGRGGASAGETLRPPARVLCARAARRG